MIALVHIHKDIFTKIFEKDGQMELGHKEINFFSIMPLTSILCLIRRLHSVTWHAVLSGKPSSQISSGPCLLGTLSQLRENMRSLQADLSRRRRTGDYSRGCGLGRVCVRYRRFLGFLMVSLQRE